MDNLPDEVLALVFAFMCCPERALWVAPVCRRWRAVACDRSAMGRHLCTENGPPRAEADPELARQNKRKRICKAALRLGHLDCLAYARPSDGTFDESSWYTAARYPVDDAALYTLDKTTDGALWYDDVLRRAIYYGRTACVSLALAKGAQFGEPEECHCMHLRFCTHTGGRWICGATDPRSHAACLRLILEAGQEVDDDACFEAVAAGHTECLGVLLDHGHTCCINAPIRAAADGRLDLLRLICRLDDDAIEWSPDALRGAARNGHLDCVIYLRETGCDWDAKTCAAAAEAPTVDCLQFLRESGCPWDARTTASAARGGSLDCLRYAHEKGCPWDNKTWADAVDGGHAECIAYLRDRGCPGSQPPAGNRP
ncbi:Ankyrin repeat domain containing protein [Pandoravirus macleodensis]|uniref:Ankyrin repeat domain containing protein n=1 Tax=Pandoravirus macleodensis TaxID=2107707 RepID=A0A2U7UFL2_9VIRU|nr:Ankyrin repeat domain containing protein [Pandoravirus macleodensis]AVK77202.1 Ankyrin repeat domain containing protein [Pandoravirus macleodensis]